MFRLIKKECEKKKVGGKRAQKNRPQKLFEKRGLFQQKKRGLKKGKIQNKQKLRVYQPKNVAKPVWQFWQK